MLEAEILIIFGFIIIYQMFRTSGLEKFIKIQDELIESQNALIYSDRKLIKEQHNIIVKLKTYIDENEGED